MRIRFKYLPLISFCLVGCFNISSDMIETRRIDAENEKFKSTLPSPNADYGILPKNYQKKATEYLKSTLKDPDSAKFSNFTKPRKEHVIYSKGKYITPNDVFYGYSTCVLVNAKNSYGGYVGNQLYWIFFYNREVFRTQKVDVGFGASIYRGRAINCEDGD
ncbi:hypothetical protein [Lonepinella koalarum]|uniref:hypothetical protein n=1 Tax=Lonepinella koalarum TaxID=53417 RepID=UPI0012AAD31B